MRIIIIISFQEIVRIRSGLLGFVNYAFIFVLYTKQSVLSGRRLDDVDVFASLTQIEEIFKMSHNHRHIRTSYSEFFEENDGEQNNLPRYQLKMTLNALT